MDFLLSQTSSCFHQSNESLVEQCLTAIYREKDTLDLAEEEFASSSLVNFDEAVVREELPIVKYLNNFHKIDLSNSQTEGKKNEPETNILDDEINEESTNREMALTSSSYEKEVQFEPELQGKAPQETIENQNSKRGRKRKTTKTEGKQSKRSKKDDKECEKSSESEEIKTQTLSVAAKKPAKKAFTRSKKTASIAHPIISMRLQMRAILNNYA
jgi:hypothetical protein